MDFDLTCPIVREPAAFEKYFDMETNLMVAEGYSSKPEALDLRKRALILLDQLGTGEDALIPYLARNYFDRFASREQLRVEDLQLAVICCIFLASKLRDNSFSVSEFLTKRPSLKIDQDLILTMETRILNALAWKLRSGNALWFVRYFLQMLHYDLHPSQEKVLKIIIQAEDIGFTRFRPSVIAASAILTAGLDQFPGKFNEYLNKIRSCSHVNMEELKQCIKNMMRMHREKRILGKTSPAGDALVPECPETMEDSQTRPKEQPMYENSKTMEDTLTVEDKEVKHQWFESQNPSNKTEEVLIGGSLRESLQEIEPDEWLHLMDEISGRSLKVDDARELGDKRRRRELRTQVDH